MSGKGFESDELKSKDFTLDPKFTSPYWGWGYPTVAVSYPGYTSALPVYPTSTAGWDRQFGFGFPGFGFPGFGFPGFGFGFGFPFFRPFWGFPFWGPFI